MSSWLPVLSGASGLLLGSVFGDTQLSRKRPSSSAVTIGSRFGTVWLFAVIWTSAPLMLPSSSRVPSLLKAWMNTSPLLPARRSQDRAKRPFSSAVTLGLISLKSKPPPSEPRTSTCGVPSDVAVGLEELSHDVGRGLDR